MSYVSENERGNPATMGAAILVNGLIILAVALSPIVAEYVPVPTIITGRNIVDSPPPPPNDPVEQQQAKKVEPIFVPDRAIDTKVLTDTNITTTDVATDTGTIIDGLGGDDDFAEPVHMLPKMPLPIFKAAFRDPRFARSFQPEYPVGKLRLEIEGSVTVRVLVGTDGRVHEVQVLRTTDPDFASATERQALKAWRFKPATRDGKPVEDWQTLTVRFDIS
jgi:periplasmic protein TonB